jgi:hypothetical protein
MFDFLSNIIFVMQDLFNSNDHCLSDEGTLMYMNEYIFLPHVLIEWFLNDSIVASKCAFEDSIVLLNLLFNAIYSALESV